MSKDTDVERIVHGFRLLTQRNAAAVARRFSPELRAVMPDPLLQMAWEHLTGKVGHFERVLRTETYQGQTSRVVLFYCAFSQNVREVAIGVRLGAGSQIHGFFGYVLKHNTAFTRARIPPYVRPNYFTEREVVVGRVPWTVTGTLTRPVWEGPFPGVVLVNSHGHDRNGLFDIFRDLAWGLATQGIMVLRYDHNLSAHPERDWYRGHLESDGQRGAAPMTIRDDILDDASSALQILRLDPASNGQLYAVGHGLGGYLLPRLAYQYGAPLGLVSLFGHFRPPWEVLADDAARAAGPSSPEPRRKFAVLLQDALYRIPRNWLSDDQRIAGMSGRYWADLREHHGRYAADDHTPILVIHGEGDPTAGGLAEFERIKQRLEAHPRATFSLYPRLNFWLKPIAHEYDPLRDLARTQHQPVDQRLIDDLGRWIRMTTVV